MSDIHFGAITLFKQSNANQSGIRRIIGGESKEVKTRFDDAIRDYLTENGLAREDVMVVKLPQSRLVVDGDSKQIYENRLWQEYDHWGSADDSDAAWELREKADRAGRAYRTPSDLVDQYYARHPETRVIDLDA